MATNDTAEMVYSERDFMDAVRAARKAQGDAANLRHHGCNPEASFRREREAYRKVARMAQHMVRNSLSNEAGEDSR